jgi:hypothetical protein
MKAMDEFATQSQADFESVCDQDGTRGFHGLIALKRTLDRVDDQAWFFGATVFGCQVPGSN